MPEAYADGHVTIEIVPNLGRFGNNAYLVSSPRGGGVTVIDAPEGAEAIVEALAGRPVERIVVTHSHFDHWLGFDVLRAYTPAPVFAGAEETNLDTARAIRPLADGATLDVGGAELRVIHTPGHTPGSICLHIAGDRPGSRAGDRGGAVLTGDTLFPGGPGRTGSPAVLAQEIESITSRLHTLPDETVVLPGHGDATTIARSIEEYRAFASKRHADDLHGDVLWLES